MDDDNDAGLLALPIGVCFLSSGMPPRVYTKYTCSGDGSSVSKVKYSDSFCTIPTGDYQVINKATATNGYGKYTFECTGADNYVVTGAYFNIDVPDTECTMLRGEVPVSMGCYQDSATTSYEFSHHLSFCGVDGLSPSIYVPSSSSSSHRT